MTTAATGPTAGTTGPAPASPAPPSPARPSAAPASPAPAAAAPPPQHTAEADDDGVRALSPSRASDFMLCPLLYRFRMIDQLPEPPSPPAVRGSLVHLVLEKLFELGAVDRTREQATALLVPAWDELLAGDERAAQLFADDADLTGWMAQAAELLDRYFALEDPSRYEPAEREALVEAELESGLRLRGYVDRLDVAPDGRVRIVDYKTGSSPAEHFEARALFQMKFYALVLWRTRGVVPAVLRLMYLGDGVFLEYSPTEHDLIATERKLEALSRAITLATETGDWRPHRTRMCEWCAHRSICPEWGGTPPPLPPPREDSSQVPPD